MFEKILAVAIAAVLTWGVWARTSQGSGGAQTYVVKPTDTLWAIAVSQYAGDPRDAVYRLEQRNHLSSDVLRPGQRLILP